MTRLEQLVKDEMAMSFGASMADLLAVAKAARLFVQYHPGKSQHPVWCEIHDGYECGCGIGTICAALAPLLEQVKEGE